MSCRARMMRKEEFNWPMPEGPVTDWVPYVTLSHVVS